MYASSIAKLKRKRRKQHVNNIKAKTPKTKIKNRSPCITCANTTSPTWQDTSSLKVAVPEAAAIYSPSDPGCGPSEDIWSVVMRCVCAREDWVSLSSTSMVFVSAYPHQRPARRPVFVRRSDAVQHQTCCHSVTVLALPCLTPCSCRYFDFLSVARQAQAVSVSAQTDG